MRQSRQQQQGDCGIRLKLGSVRTSEFPLKNHRVKKYIACPACHFKRQTSFLFPAPLRLPGKEQRTGKPIHTFFVFLIVSFSQKIFQNVNESADVLEGACRSEGTYTLYQVGNAQRFTNKINFKKVLFFLKKIYQDSAAEGKAFAIPKRFNCGTYKPMNPTWESK